MIHDIKSTPEPGTSRYRHECQRCGIVKVTGKPNWVDICQGGQDGPPRDPWGCIYLGDPTGEEAQCEGCPGSPRVHVVFACKIFKKCLPDTAHTQVPHRCTDCDAYVVKQTPT